MCEASSPRSRFDSLSRSLYSCFLSHYKAQAGMEARYLNDMLQKLLRRECFLDSQNLTNLRDLISCGLLNFYYYLRPGCEKPGV